MSDGEEKFSAAFWGIVAVSAVGLGVGVAFLAGYFLGHFTGHTKTETVAAASAEAGEAGTASLTAIKAAPAFTAAELAEAPTTNWLTNGGSLSNQRYSPLEEIETENVSSLKGVW